MKRMSHSYSPHLFLSIVTVFLGLCLPIVVADSQSLLFTLIEGDFELGKAFDVTTDAVNNIYLTGTAIPMNEYSSRAFVSKYTPEGVRIYMKTLVYYGGIGYSVVTDSNLNLYLGGRTCESISSQPFGGICDALLMKLDANGTEVYVKAFGTEADDGVTSLAIDNADNLFAGGHCNNYVQAFIRKYNSVGDLLFEQVIDYSYSPSIIYSSKTTNIVLDSEGSVYATTQDAYLTKLNNTGALQFTRMIEVGNTNVVGRGLARDSLDNVYVVSDSLINHNSILTKFSKDGTTLWNITEFVEGLAVAVDQTDNVYTCTAKSQFLPEYSKPILYGYSSQGERIWSRVANNIYAIVTSLHVDAANNLLWAGWANNTITNASYTNHAYVAKYSLLNSSLPTPPTNSPTTIPTSNTTAPSTPPNTTCVSLEMVRKAEELLSQANRLVEEAKVLLSALSIPSTLSPTYTPTRSPSQLPSWMPSSKPTSRPTSVPSSVPSAQPTTPCVSVETVRRAKAKLQEADRLFDEAYTLLAAASGNNGV